MDTKIVRFTIDIPADMHKQFKALCVNQGASMKHVVEELIKSFITQSRES